MIYGINHKILNDPKLNIIIILDNWLNFKEIINTNKYLFFFFLFIIDWILLINKRIQWIVKS